MKDPYSIIKNPLSTEKSIRLMESENKLIFAVDKKATKQDIKRSVEKLFKAKVKKVNTFITQAGEKRAYVRFAADTPAIDIATQLGLI
ncbi:50S ribosomal protein L23 [Candidatus Woesearchaeota archaeon]|nr:50S ribosomal protein L23 [Candidatus Woesearchaeota archaeon]